MQQRKKSMMATTTGMAINQTKYAVTAYNSMKENKPKS